MGTAYNGSRREKQALNTLIKLMRASDVVEISIRKSQAGAGLTPSQLGIMECILHLGPMRQNELAAKLLKTGGNITTVIDNLEKKRLLKRTAQVGDRRSYLICLTSKGKQLISDFFPEHVRVITTLMSPLTEKEQKVLERLLKKLGRGIAEMARTPEDPKDWKRNHGDTAN